MANAQKRIGELVRTLERAVDSGHLKTTDAESLRGRLGFADSHFFGRAGRRVLHLLGKHALYSQSSKLP